MAKGWTKQFCVNSHDTSKTGKSKSGECVVCAQVRQQAPAYKAYQKKYKVSLPKSYSREAQLKHKYGITLTEYFDLVEKQRGLCGICCKASNHLSVDHDHITKTVRGLLCQPCNMGLGLFKDNAISLKAAISYLQGK